MGYGQADQTDRELMELALGQARASLSRGGVPVGAVLTTGDQVIAAGHNERVQRGDPVAHGEIACLRNAGRRATYAGTVLYTTLSPCPMCSGAVLLFQIPGSWSARRRRTKATSPSWPTAASRSSCSATPIAWR